MSAHPATRSTEQRDASLVLANHVRIYRARLKTSIKTGDVDPVAVLENPAPETMTMKVIAVLVATPGMQQIRAEELLVRVGASWRKTVGGLSPRQRREIVRELRGELERRDARRARGQRRSLA